VLSWISSALTVLLLGAAASLPAVPVQGDKPRTHTTTHARARAMTQPEARTPEGVLASMTLGQRVGELLMVGTPTEGASAEARAAIGHYHVGGVILMGNSAKGRRSVSATTAALQRRATAAATAGTGLLIATDQEGGQVQRLTGPGFSSMPTALSQGSWSVPTLQTRARGWAGELRAAGINLDLAPVADTVPARDAGANLPIGHWQRELGHRPAQVAGHAAAIVRGMRAAGVATAAKHFPGLGRVRGNTDFAATVVDRVTRRHDPYLRPFAATVRAGVPFMMMSLATYPRLDKTAPAAFSHRIVQRMLRRGLGFDGVVVSDSLTAVAAQRYPAGQRAVRFVRAGGDLALVPEVAPIATMYAALLATARRDPAFRTRVDDAALHVLRAKQALGLL